MCACSTIGGGACCHEHPIPQVLGVEFPPRPTKPSTPPRSVILVVGERRNSGDGGKCCLIALLACCAGCCLADCCD
ncbi:unnamed protein product [Heligmosomoides polygyrus]|uniref:CYSTM domain-containing protein n=1 Tax=Heligmosomoides polygyrus TaxID=6339 RepID=A0A183G591_HELPZ|nr:unnamed protein product [Heligmosomoides polygyrus]